MNAVAAMVMTAVLAGDGQQTLEWRVYRNTEPAKQTAVLDFAADALVPALKRHGVGPVGVFQPIDAADADVYVLIPYDSPDDVTRTRDALTADEAYQQAAQSFLSTPVKQPNYVRCDTSLMRAFAGLPHVTVPALTNGNQPRIFEFRTYESHNEHKARFKVEMFNEGEIAIMQDVGLAPVFYGEVLAGGDAPCLKYMMSGPNLDEHKAHFEAFLKHPDWDVLKKNPRYAGTVSKITKTLLKPARGSEI